MNRDINKIFWGLVFILVDINIGYVDIMPDIFGYVLITMGVFGMGHENKFFIRARFASYSMILICVVNMILESKGLSGKLFDVSIILRIYGFVSMLINLYLIFLVCQGIKVYLVYRERENLLNQLILHGISSQVYFL